ncbi:hypothetical protein [Sphingobium sp. DC-2]|uniref:hypothetical protein n=1 Tax=Sphingobium sp. DC-2 TaxID=1303256 RepID=UPI000A8AB738|nr:hypothetical protein [Sphingobium sp. DC-2]
MPYDVPFRHHQALDPSALTSLGAALHAINRGIEDCRVAGIGPDSDPAILLLARHLARLAEAAGEEPALRSACTRRIAELDRYPALLALALRGVSHDKAAKDRFHRDGRHAMRRLAIALDLPEGRYEVASHYGDAAISGSVVLTTPEIEVSLAIGPLHEDNEASYFAKRGPAAGERLRFARISAFLKAERFATRLKRELRLADIAPAPGPTIVAAMPADMPVPALMPMAPAAAQPLAA